MARYIYCIDCNKRNSEVAEHYKEYYHDTLGFLKHHCICDSCNCELPENTRVAAVEDRPLKDWLHEYFKTPKEYMETLGKVETIKVDLELLKKAYNKLVEINSIFKTEETGLLYLEKFLSLLCTNLEKSYPMVLFPEIKNN